MLVAFSLVSCGKDFFDLSPNYEVAVDNTFKTAEDFDVAVKGCYAKLQGQVNYYLELCEYGSDNLYLSAPTAGTQDRYDIDQFRETPSNGIIEDAWANFNNGVYRCNMVLDRIDAAQIDGTLKSQYKGEALFVRALTYFNMYRLWGGVPVTRKVVSVAEALKIGRSTEQEMYDLIAGDLETIVGEGMLPVSYNDADAGRATMGAAKALLGKVYLTFGQPQKAADILDDLIGQYSLLKDVADVFNVSNKMNPEIIFAVRFNKEVVGEGHGAWFSITNLTDNSGQTPVLKGLYDGPDARRQLIEYVQVSGVNLCLMRKFMDTPDATTNQYGNDQILLRYADVLLMYAEALNEVAYNGSQDSPALAALNQVHVRAGLDPLNITELPDQDAFRRAVCIERQKEFPYEGHRWFDLVRMGYAAEAVAAEGHAIQNWQMLYPIPTTELERINNPSLLWQNPGY